MSRTERTEINNKDRTVITEKRTSKILVTPSSRLSAARRVCGHRL